MWLMPSSMRVFVAVEPVDFRAGFDRLILLVRARLEEDASSGHLYVFRNRRCTQLKVLFFDRTGYVIVHKRLERGTFRLSRDAASGATRIEVDTSELGLMLEGIELRGALKRTRWRKQQAGDSKH